MRSSFIKVVLLLVAIAGVAAIGWYLLMNGGMDKDMAQGDSVKVEQTAAETPAASTDEAKPQESATAAPAAPAMPANGAADMSAMTPADFSASYDATSEAERAAFVTDYVVAAGEKQAYLTARALSRGAAEGRNYPASFAIAQVLVVEHDSRIASYLAGVLAMRGLGTEKDLAAATRYLRHPALLESPTALYHRATMLIDPEYTAPDQAAAVGLLKKAIKLSKPDDAIVAKAQKLLDQLGAG